MSPALEDKPIVLIVEDNDLNLKLFRDLLEAHGLGVVATQNGDEALHLVRTVRPNLVLMDIQLHGISGLDIIREMMKEEEMAHIPVIAVTAFAMKDDREKILNSGCRDYISKPISIGPFLDTIDKYLYKTTTA